jgi:hypothetical protein
MRETKGESSFEKESFWHHIVECDLDASGFTPGCSVHDLGNAKVSKDRSVKRIEEDVWWLNIPHHKTTPMYLSKRTVEGMDVVTDLVSIKRSISDLFFE